MPGPFSPARRRLTTCLLLILLTLSVAGCGTSDKTAERQLAGSGLQMFGGHVHALEVNPADDQLYVASHVGVFRQTESGFERIADRWQDTMSFTVVGPDHFLASGHPDTREDKPPHLGLIESTDGAETWRTRSLEGQADFHALESVDGRVYGLDSRSGRLLVTTDKSSWRSLGRVAAVDLAAVPGDRDSLLVTGPRGEVVRLASGGTSEPLPDAPPLVFLDSEEDTVVGVGPGGEVHRSTDGGRTWAERSALPGAPHALGVTRERWYAATERGLFQSEDEGDSWEPVDGAA